MPADQRTGNLRSGDVLVRKQLPGVVVEAEDVPGGVERQQEFRVYIGKLLRGAKLDDPLASELLEEIGLLDVVGVVLDELEG